MTRSGTKLQKVNLEGKGDKLSTQNVGKLQLRISIFSSIFPLFLSPAFDLFLYSLLYTPAHPPSFPIFFCTVENNFTILIYLAMRIDFTAD